MTPTRDDAGEASAAQSLPAPAPCDGAARNGPPPSLWEDGIESLRSICLPTLDEMTWRFNNRKNPFLFRDTMLKLIHSENLEYKELVMAA
jgi:hypothetical protein